MCLGPLIVFSYVEVPLNAEKNPSLSFFFFQCHVSPLLLKKLKILVVLPYTTGNSSQSLGIEHDGR